MNECLLIDRHAGELRRAEDRFDGWALRWEPGEGGAADGAEPVGVVEAVRWLHARGPVRRVPVAVIGPKEATAAHLATAEALGAALAGIGLTLITGGRQGVMEAASRGAARAGGLVIGLLPEDEWRAANDHVTVPLASGIGVARNALIARSAFALVAVGGGYGTLTEMAYGKHFDRTVLALEDAPVVDGVPRCPSVEEAVVAVARAFLRLPASSG
ncbi:MAG: LOG family protein [Ectothiorhodospiraceae bacterium]|nr:LOG family protein [Ectothiorhodospiraceae bacterium]